MKGRGPVDHDLKGSVRVGNPGRGALVESSLAPTWVCIDGVLFYFFIFSQIAYAIDPARDLKHVSVRILFSLLYTHSLSLSSCLSVH